MHYLLIFLCNFGISQLCVYSKTASNYMTFSVRVTITLGSVIETRIRRVFLQHQLQCGSYEIYNQLTHCFLHCFHNKMILSLTFILLQPQVMIVNGSVQRMKNRGVEKTCCMRPIRKSDFVLCRHSYWIMLCHSNQY